MKITHIFHEAEHHFADEVGQSHYTMTIEADTWMSHLEAFEDFLRGLGYVFDGHFDLVKNEPAQVDPPFSPPSPTRGTCRRP